MVNRLLVCRYCAVSLPSNLIPRHEGGCIGRPPTIERLFIAGKIAETTSGCLIWRAKLNSHGYGILTNMSAAIIGNYRAHRAALILTVGAPPIGRDKALHSCDTPPCICPDHLRWGTQDENMAEARSRRRMTPPPRTHDRPRETIPCPVCGTSFTRPVGGTNIRMTCGRSCGSRFAYARRITRT